MPLLFVCDWEDRESWRARLKEHMPDIDFRMWPEETGDAADIDAALVWKPPAGLLASLPNLKVIISLGMGVDHVFADLELPRGVPVARIVDDDLVDRMSEYVVHAVLHYHRDADLYDQHQREKRWAPKPGPHASSRRIGILGMGAIGADAAAKLAALNFDVAGWSRSKKTVEGVRSFHGSGQLHPFLARSEYVVCILPLTPETEGVLNKDAFDAMPAGGGVINVGRGGHVVDEDLIAALDSGQLSFAKLDVFREEPLSRDHPFWTHPKIRITPHNAGITNPDTAAAQIVENYRRALAGEALLNTVDPKKGY